MFFFFKQKTAYDTVIHFVILLVRLFQSFVDHPQYTDIRFCSDGMTDEDAFRGLFRDYQDGAVRQELGFRDHGFCNDLWYDSRGSPDLVLLLNVLNYINLVSRYKPVTLSEIDEGNPQVWIAFVCLGFVNISKCREGIGDILPC